MSAGKTLLVSVRWLRRETKLFGASPLFAEVMDVSVPHGPVLYGETWAVSAAQSGTTEARQATPASVECYTNMALLRQNAVATKCETLSATHFNS